MTDFTALSEVFHKLSDECTDELALPWYRAASSVLHFVRELTIDPDAWESLAATEPQRTKTDLVAQASAVILDADPDLRAGHVFAHATPEALDALEAFASRASVGLVPGDFDIAVLANAIAQAIDNHYGSTFLEWFRKDNHFTIESGEAHPIFDVDPRYWLGDHQVNTSRAGLPTRRFDITTRLGISDHATAGLRYEYFFDAFNRLGPVGEEDIVVAVLQPTLSLAEYDIPDTEDRDSFVNLGPVDPHGQVATIKAMILDAVSRGATFVMLPEYSLTHEMRDHLTDELTASISQPLLVVAGLVSEPDEQQYVTNQCTYMIFNDAGLPYCFDGPPKVHPAVVDGRSERIHRGSTIQIVVGQRITMAVLLCRDVMAPEIIDQLGSLGVNILLVPAMTPKTSSLVSSAVTLAHTSQAFVVVGSSPATFVSGDSEVRHNPLRREAVFAGPYAHDPQTFTFPDDDVADLSERGYWIFSFRRRNGEWVPYNY